MITKYNELSNLVKSGFSDWQSLGEVAVKEKDELLLFNYTIQAEINGNWTWLEQISRGLIVNATTGEIVARPFQKFFNWMQQGRCTNAHLLEVTEKMDGSLGIGYFHNGEWKIATRGSFDGKQAQWATKFGHEFNALDGWPMNLTPLFEIVYPENRIVVDYGQREELVLIGAIDRFTGEDMLFYPVLYNLAQQFGFSLPTFYSFNSWKAIMDARDNLGWNEEGFVGRFADGSRFKFKGNKYLEAHKLMNNLSFKNVLQAVRDGTLNEMLGSVPDEFLSRIKTIENQIYDMYDAIEYEIIRAYTYRPHNCTRKEYAQWVNTEHRDTARYLFALLDGKEIDNMIYDEILNKEKEQ